MDEGDDEDDPTNNSIDESGRVRNLLSLRAFRIYNPRLRRPPAVVSHLTDCLDD